MKKLFWLTFIFLDACVYFIVEASVTRNPFLRPGSNQKPPPPVTNTFKPKSVSQKDMSKEIEFRGYFVLKGKPFFCLLNKKSNHAEWVSLSEITYEQFEASEFDLETEILTVLYEGSRYELSLIQGGTSMASGSSSIPPRASLLTPSNKSSASSNQARFMPPRPKTTPKLPEWLANKKENSLPLPFNRNTSSGGATNSGIVPRRIAPGLPFPSSQVSDNNPSSTSINSIIEKSPSLSTSIPSQSAPNNSSSPAANSAVENVPNSSPSKASQSSSSDLDLNSLPPPPPPPNIVPPSPPPDIIPSREN